MLSNFPMTWPPTVSDSESHISFASEHASLRIKEGDVREKTAHDFVVQKLYDELLHDFHGCTQDQHYEDSRRHMADVNILNKCALHVQYRASTPKSAYGTPSCFLECDYVDVCTIPEDMRWPH